MKFGFKRVMATCMAMLITLTCAPQNGFATLRVKAATIEEGLSSVAVVDQTAYGVLDTDVKAYKVTLGEEYYLHSHKVNYNPKWDNYGEGFVLVEDEAGTTFYLVGTKGVVKSFYSDDGTEPRFSLLNTYSIDFPYALYRVYNPETEKYDVYNANTCHYYDYALDAVTSYSQYASSYDYVKNVFEIEKDGKYGIINYKGQMLYSPIYDDIYLYKNGFIGACRSENDLMQYAVLSKNGVTSGTQYYDQYLAYDSTLFAVSDIETDNSSDYKDWALLNKDLTLMTDFLYSSVSIAECDGIYYRVCSTYYEETNYYGQSVGFSQHEVISDNGNGWNVCEQFNCVSSGVGIYNSTVRVCENGLRISITDDYGYYTLQGTGWINPDLNPPKFTKRYILAKPNGEMVFNLLEPEEYSRVERDRWESIQAVYGKCEHRKELVGSAAGYVNNLYDRKGKLISQITPSCLTVAGNYLIHNHSTQEKSFIYDYVNEKMVLSNIYISSVAADGVFFAESETSNMWAVFNATTGEYTDYVIETTGTSFSIVDSITNGSRTLWIGYSNDTYYYVSDAGKTLSTRNYYINNIGDVLKNGDYLIKILDHQSGFDYDTYGVAIIDYDGNEKKRFNRKVCSNFKEADAYISVDEDGFGLINQSGTTVMESLDVDIGICYNGLSYVYEYGYSEDYASVVDSRGNALMYGAFDIEDYNDSFETVGATGFASFVKEDAVYIYDFTACLGFDQNTDSSVVTEDHLFGEYSAFLNNGFYNSLADTAGTLVVNSFIHYSDYARAIAFAKSAMDGQTGYLIQKLTDIVEDSSLSETKAKQEMAMEYLNSLDTETTSKYLSTLADLNDLASKLKDSTKLDYKLDSGNSKLEFIKRWDDANFTTSEIYGVIEEAKKHQNRFDAYFEKTGRTIEVLEYVSSYLSIYMLQRDLVKSLMELVPRNSDLYEGLNCIYVKQSEPGAVVSLVSEMLTDEILGAFADLVDKGFMALADVKNNANVTSLILTIGFKLASLTIPGPKLEDIDKAILAYANVCTLKTAIKQYQKKIADNYSNGGNIPIETLKTEYSLLCDTYYKALFTALKYAKEIAPDAEKKVITRHTEDFEKKFIYRSYIKTCLLNARTQWEYTVRANKAIVTNFKAQYPSGEGRVAYVELYESNFSEKREQAKTIYSYEYAIDVPASIDGYPVSAVGSSSFSDNHRVTGVYIPDSVVSIENSAFKNCQQMNAVYLGSSVETIGDNAFENCDDLRFVDIPDSVNTMGENSFAGVDNLLVTGSNEELLGNITSDNVTTQTRDLTATSLKIIQSATKTEMEMQEELDTTGLVIRITYTDGSTQDVTEGFYADIYNRVVGENIVSVSYEGITVTYPVTIRESLCTYTIRYQDQLGNQLATPFTGTAMAGSTLDVTMPTIPNYIPTNDTQTETIGYHNDFVVTYSKVSKTSIEDAIITVKKQEFANAPLKPKVMVMLDGVALIRDQDFVVTYANNYYVGTAVAAILGIGEYDGMVTANFEIFEKEHSWSPWDIYYEPDDNYPGVKYRTCAGCNKWDFKEYVDENHKHRYTSSITKATLSKNGKVVNKCSVCGYSKTTTVYYPKTIKLSTTAYTYNGKVKTPSVTVKDSKGTTLKKNTDYTVAYESGRKLPGKYTVKITFKGKYTGTKSLYFTIAPKATSKITASQTTSTITLKWSKVTGADIYRVYKYNTKTKKYEKFKDVTGTSLKISKLKAGTAYKYKVRAYTKDGDTIWGAYSNMFETATKPATSKITKLTTTKGKASFTWSNVSGETGYEVYYSTRKSSGYKKLASYKVNVTKGSKSKLTSKKTYYFKVRSYKKTATGKVYSSWSTIKSIKIK